MDNLLSAFKSFFLNSCLLIADLDIRSKLKGPLQRERERERERERKLMKTIYKDAASGTATDDDDDAVENNQIIESKRKLSSKQLFKKF